MERFIKAAGRAVITAGLGLLALIGSAAAGTVLSEHLDSKAIGRPYNYTVYLPDDYAGSCRLYPVIYLLHGANGDENDWLVKGKVAETLDRLIASGHIQPVIVVMPGHKKMWWVDGNAEPAETVLLTELLPEVERRFRTLADRAGRGVAGLSAGGYATIRLAFRRPDLFVAGAALSPAVYQPEPPVTSSAVKDPPFQKGGAFDPETWSRLNWPTLIDAYLAQPQVVALFLNSGDHDRFDIAYHAATLFQRLLHHQADAVVFRVVDGDHEWPVWQRTIGEALEFMLSRMSRPRTAGPEACR